MFKVEQSEMYKLISYSKGLIRVFDRYSDLIEYVYSSGMDLYTRLKDREHIEELMDFSGGDVYWESKEGGTCSKERKPYFVLDSNGNRINAAEFKREYEKLRVRKEAIHKSILEWSRANAEKYGNYRWYGPRSIDNLYYNRNRKSFTPKRGNPIPYTGTKGRWHGFYRSPKYRCRILTNINTDTGGYYDSKYKKTNMPVWDDRPRKNEHCWKDQKKCRKQWMKHKKPSEVYWDKYRIDPEDLEENVA